MSVRAWFFLRRRPGDLRAFPLSRMDEFFSNRRALDADEDGIVRYVQVVVVLEQRRAVAAHSVAYFQARVGPDGRLDRQHTLDVIATAMNVVAGRVLSEKPPLGVIDAGARFAERRLEHISHWKPTDADQTRLRELVNRRAGRTIL